MAIIKPFKGIRPPKELVEQVASRPYDVLNSEEAREEAKGNEKSLYHIIKPEIDFPAGTDEHDAKVYDKAAENFRMFQDKGWLVQDEKENYYVYAQTMNGKTQYGLVVGAYVPDYMNGIIKKHELTRRDKEEDRMKHVRVNNANIEPVFFAYPDNAELDAIVKKYTSQKPEYDFIAPGDGFGHSFWVIDRENDIEAITKAFAAMPALYIADGHHRSAAAALVGAEKAKQNPNHKGDEEYNYFMAVCFPANQLTIIDYNRVVKDLNGLTPEEFLAAVGKNFVIEEKGAKEAIRLLKNANQVSSFCNDVVGDICGIVSGSTAAVIVTHLQRDLSTTSVLISIGATALISGITIGGKALGKTVAINQCTSVVYRVARIMHALHLSR